MEENHDDTRRYVPGGTEGARETEGKFPGPYRSPVYVFCLCPPGGEALFPKSTVILPALFANLRREPVRQCRAMVQGPGEQGPVVLDAGGVFRIKEGLFFATKHCA